MESEVQSRVDDYLLRADASLLRRGATPAQRLSIHIELHERILNLFAARMHRQASEPDSAPMTPDDADAVLDELGPAEAQAFTPALTPAKAHRHVSQRSLCWLAVLGLLWAILLPVMLGLFSVLPEIPRNMSIPWWRSVLQGTILPLGWDAWAATPVLGLLALDRIRTSKGRLYGLSLALFDVVLFPLLTLDGIVYWACLALNRRLGGTNASDDIISIAVAQVLPAVACVLCDYFLVAWLWKIVQRDSRLSK